MRNSGYLSMSKATMALVILCALMIMLSIFSIPFLGKGVEISTAIPVAISAVAVLVASISIFFQARATLIVNLQTIRESHRELLVMAIQDSDLMALFGFQDFSDEENKKLAYANLMINHWNLTYRLGQVSLPTVYKVARYELFASDTGRFYWDNYGRNWGQFSRDRKQILFAREMERAYRDAIEAFPGSE